jgi:predicted nucleotidyltransferase
MDMRGSLEVTPGQRRALLALLRRHLPGTTVWAYGSRTTGRSRACSDLDLVAFATPEQSRQVADLREACEESNLPFRVDLLVWDEAPESFRAALAAAHVVVVTGRAAPPAVAVHTP